MRALSIWSHPHRWTTPHEQTSITILPLRLGRPLALVAGPGCSVCPAGDVFVISGACPSLPLFSALLPIRPSAVIQHSQPREAGSAPVDSGLVTVAIISSLRLGAVSSWLSARRWRSMGRAGPLSSVDGLKPLLPAALKTQHVIYISTSRSISR